MLNLDCGIYTITSPSGRQYVGSAVSFRRRWTLHLSLLRAGSHHCPPLQRAFNKYGEANLQFGIVAIVPREQLIAREQEQINERGFSNLYNILPTAGSPLGRVLSTETKAKLRQALRGRSFSAETREKMRAAQLGRKQTEATIAKRAKALSGRTISRETRHKISAAQVGLARPNQSSISGIPGVIKVTEHRWRAQFGQIYLGNHKTAEAAQQAIEDYKASGVVPKITRTNNVSGYPGVTAHGKKWQASIRIASKRKHLGTYDTPEAAHAAILAAQSDN